MITFENITHCPFCKSLLKEEVFDIAAWNNSGTSKIRSCGCKNLLGWHTFQVFIENDKIRWLHSLINKDYRILIYDNVCFVDITKQAPTNHSINLEGINLSTINNFSELKILIDKLSSNLHLYLKLL